MRKWQSPEYRCWQSLRQRCNNPNNPGYKNYGGRGISVCQEWNASFDAFYAYVGPRPAGKWLDRIDNNGNYEPGNVRWATPTVQRLNSRPKKVLFNPESELGRVITLFGSVGIVASVLDVDIALISRWTHQKHGVIPFQHKLKLIQVVSMHRRSLKTLLAALDCSCPLCTMKVPPRKMKALAKAAGTEMQPRSKPGPPIKDIK